ncbi:outer membrane receptor FepA [Salmonella enterica subsp. arizonae]|uniref:Outer membrane receptor FepA n=1 Tax=Salmonella enterica subsp. arizonae TaxID=59203 RepID=A0A3S4IDF8_SALER|nr:outer membrane receptor FepA [Salmonella enterica subsp. arizonae]
MELTDSTMLTPGLRFDHHSIVGDNWSPSLNLSQGLGDDFTLKMGIARAYKARVCTRLTRTIFCIVKVRAVTRLALAPASAAI